MYNYEQTEQQARTGERHLREETDRKLRYMKKRKDIRCKKDKHIENG